MPIAPIDAPETTAPATQHADTHLLICLPALTDAALNVTLHALDEAFPGEHLLIASSSPAPANTAQEWLSYPIDRSSISWVLTAADYSSAAHLAANHGADSVLLLGGESDTIDVQSLRSLVDAVRTRKVDLAVPRLPFGPTDGLVATAMLYPLTRALFGADIHAPLPVDVALSARMAQRIAPSAQRLTAAGQGSSLLWPVAEAAIAGFSVREIESSTPPPEPPEGDFNTLFSSVVQSLFSDVDAKATFWQRARAVSQRPLAKLNPTPAGTEVTAEISSMMESFHLAHDNLQEIWSLVLPPQSRLALKKLSQLAPDAFTLDPALWARLVYDFALAFHLRTLNRNHLLGAMTPLYLAWAASHLRSVGEDANRAAIAMEETAIAFEAEKSYLVSRWRWPDRFNP